MFGSFILFNTSVNGLEQVVEYTLTRPTDDAKEGGVVDRLEGRAAI